MSKKKKAPKRKVHVIGKLKPVPEPVVVVALPKTLWQQFTEWISGT